MFSFNWPPESKEVMFELRHQWFRPKRFGWGVQPISIKGWGYLLLWTAILLVPGFLMVRVRKPIFGFIWISSATVAMTVDVWFILRQIKKAANPSPKLTSKAH